MPEARVIQLREGDVAVRDAQPFVPDDYAPGAEPGEWERRLAGALAFARRRITGDYPIDDFGFDPDLTDHVFMNLVRPLYEKWFRVEARGLENVPSTGGAL